MDRFASILYDLGKEIGADLYPDEKRICQLNFEGKLHLQIQYDETKEQIVIASFLTEVPAGKYRETLFKEALKSNAEYPRVGTLAYSGRNNQLTLFAYFSGREHSMEKLFLLLKAFIEKGIAWKEAIEQGKELPTSTKSELPKGPFLGTMMLEETLRATSLAPQWQTIGIRHHHGIDLPLSALHSEHSCGIGEFFDLLPLIDWCQMVHLDVIQLLPLNQSGDDPSPYFALSAFALNPLFLSLEKLPGVDKTALTSLKALNKEPRVPYHEVQSHKFLFFRDYFQQHGAAVLRTQGFTQYVEDNPMDPTLRPV